MIQFDGDIQWWLSSVEKGCKMNTHCDVQNTIVIDWCSGIEIRGEYFIITPTDSDVKVAISKQALTQVTNEAIKKERIKVVLDG